MDFRYPLGAGRKSPQRRPDMVRRSVTAARPPAAGVAVGRDDLMPLRPGFGVPPADFDKVIEHKPTRKVFAGETLNWSDFE